MQNDAVFTYKQRRSAEQGVTNTWEHPSGQAYYVKREHYASQFGLGVGFPFMGYRLSPRLYKHHYYNTIAHVQEDHKIALNYIRQWLFIYTCQARSNLSYVYGDYFPNVNYVERPNKFVKVSSKSSSINCIFKDCPIVIAYKPASSREYVYVPAEPLVFITRILVGVFLT